MYVATAGHSAFSNHGGSKKTQMSSRNPVSFLTNPNKNNQIQQPQHHLVRHKVNTDQSSLDNYVTNDVEVGTEIIWVLKCVGYLIILIDKLMDFIKLM